MQGSARILIVDDDDLVAASLAESLRRAGFDPAWTTNGRVALEKIADAEEAPDAGPDHGGPFAVLLTDLSMPDPDGFALIRAVRQRHPSIVPLVVTGYGSIESAVEAVRLGAIDYLVKPVVDEELRLAVEKAVQQHALRDENRRLRRALDVRAGLGAIIGNDPRMRRVYEIIEAVAPSRSTVLMCGESGTGKSLVARAVHQASPRGSGPFVEIACGSIPESLLESELFGYRKGAFTGAHTDKPGRFLAAHGGTLFLDEINSASPALQLKLLRVLQERTFEPVGSNESVQVDVRVLLATNQPLENLVREGLFRQDLYYRINVVSIHLPPLRERRGDIPALADAFVRAFAEREEKRIQGLSADALALLEAYDFPGNVRELEHLIERAVVLSRKDVIEPADLPDHLRSGTRSPVLGAAGAAPDAGPAGTWQPMTLREALAEPERRILRQALAFHDGNRQKTAEALGIDRSTLYKKMRALGLDEPRDRH